MKWDGHPNLRKRPSRPNANRGRIQVAIRRSFIAANSDVRSSSQIYDWTHFRNRRMTPNLYWSVLRVLRWVATPIGRTKRGAILWKLKPDGLKRG